MPHLLTLLLLAGSAGWSAAQTATYSYDSSARLQLVDYGNGATIAYSYDSNGNLLSRNTTAPRQHAVTVNRDGDGSGAVNSSPSGIDCGAVCSHPFIEGGSATLTAIATSDSRFAGWSGGGCSGTGPCVLTVAASCTVTATFLQGSALIFADGFDESDTGRWSAAVGGE